MSEIPVRVAYARPAVVLGVVNTASTAVIVGLTTGPLEPFSISFPNPSDVRATATVPVSTSTSGPGCFTSTSGFTGCPITISFSPGATIPAGSQLAFGFIVPVASQVDASLFGSDTTNGGGAISSTTPPYWTGFYFTDTNGNFRAGAVGNHYLVIESAAPDRTPPVITPGVNPSPNAAGWNNADVTVTWSV